MNGLVAGMTVEMMLDSGSSMSHIRQDIAKCLNGMTSAGDSPKLRLASAGGEELPIVNSVKVAVKLSGIVEVPEHSFIVVEQLISQVILGVDFLQQQAVPGFGGGGGRGQPGRLPRAHCFLRAPTVLIMIF